MTYPQLYCAEQEQVTGNGSSVSSVVSGVGTKMEQKGRGTSGILQIGNAGPDFCPGNSVTAEQLATLRSLWPSSSKDLSVCVARNYEPVSELKILDEQFSEKTVGFSTFLKARSLKTCKNLQFFQKVSYPGPQTLHI